MNWIRPFNLIAPAADKSHLVASRSYLTYSKAELRDKLERNPYSYLHVINPTGLGSQAVKRGTVPFFEQVKQRYLEFREREWLQPQGENRLAIYRQTTVEHTCTGIVAGLSIQGIHSGKLKLHEQTLKRREQLFAKYLNTVSCNAEPVLCAYDDGAAPSADAIQQRMHHITANRPDMDFTTTDQIRHSIWVLSAADSKELATEAQALTPLYLADGHHRVASSLACNDMNADQPDGALMAYIIPESQLLIRGYHRELKDVHWTTNQWENSLDKLHHHIASKRVERSGLAAPDQEGIIHLHTDECTWRLTLKESSIDRVDAEILQTHIFQGVFGIEDARNDPKLHYIPGTLSSEELIHRLTSQPGRAIFEMHPISTRQIKATADRGGFLPPKSSWIEPKLRSGLFIHEI